MTRDKNRKPIHPGQYLKIDILETYKITVTDAADRLGISRKHLSNFINESVPCSLDMAKRLSIATDSSAYSWLNMQTAVDVWELEHDNGKQYQSIVRGVLFILTDGDFMKDGRQQTEQPEQVSFEDDTGLNEEETTPVNIDFPSWMFDSISREATRIGVHRQAIIKIWIAEKLKNSI